MKFKKPIQTMVIFVVLLSMMACSSTPYTEGSTINGTIEDLITKEKLLFDDKFILVKEESENGQEEFTYEIPVENFDDYEVGDVVEVVVYSNTTADAWDLDNLKFEITVHE